jgi:hypothetical protein
MTGAGRFDVRVGVENFDVVAADTQWSGVSVCGLLNRVKQGERRTSVRCRRVVFYAASRRVRRDGTLTRH